MTRERPNFRHPRRGDADPPISAGVRAKKFFMDTTYYYHLAILLDGRIAILRPDDGSQVNTFWNGFCPEEAI